MPIQWPEPVGIVMVEAMACGTPVVALENGSVTEVVIDGVTGYICHHASELPNAMGRVDLIDSMACRHRFNRFHGVQTRSTRAFRLLNNGIALRGRLQASDRQLVDEIRRS